ncbi:MAG: hypothetical protein JRI23_06950 [Deltaproteobacteria bacterium]|nr:hypothetical protein [Deltaproteobacteria bacterium]
MTDHAPTLAVTLLMALIYLVVVRLVDLNEKEPLWAVAMMFALGGLAACALGLSVNLAVLELTVVPAVLVKELARFLAIAAGVGVLTLLAVRRGWSEINGLMDGVVYGAAGGLGYATGAVFIRDLLLGPVANLTGLEPAPLSGFGLGSLALIGLSDGIFGALLGIGFAAAVHARTQLHRVLFPLVSYAAAVSAHVSYDYLAHGNALGAEGVVRKWAALLLPAMVVIGVMVVALSREKKAIREQLDGEADTGIVTADELGVLQSFVAREVLYFRTLFKGKFGVWAALRGLHNRQVQLALAKHRASAGAAKADAELGPEVRQLRAAIVELKHVLESFEGSAEVAPAERRSDPPPEDSPDESEPAAEAEDGGKE